MDRIDPVDLRIRRAEASDADAVARTYASPSSYRNTLQLPMPSPDAWRARIAGVDPDGVMLVAEVRDGADATRFEVVGNIGLHPAGKSLRRRHAMAIGMNVRDDWQGRGIGTAMMDAILDRADHWMHVLRIELEVFVDNAAAIALYRRFGFVVEGTHRAHALRDGEYVDSYSMARLHPRPPRLPTLAQEE